MIQRNRTVYDCTDVKAKDIEAPAQKMYYDLSRMVLYSTMSHPELDLMFRWMR